MVRSLHVDKPGALQEVDQQERSREELRAANVAGLEKSAYQGQSECFTMAGMMETNPQPSPEPPASDAANPAPAFAPVMTEERRESALWEIFVGPEGLYPGARWLIYLSMGIAIVLAEGVVLHYVYPRHGAPVWWRMMYETSLLVAAVLPGVAMARFEGVPFGEFGLPLRNAFGRNFWVGALWGIVSLTVLMLALRAAGAFYFGSLALAGRRIVVFALYYAIFFLITGLFEEFLLRGYSQWVLTKGMHFWPAAALLSGIFGAIHGFNPGEARTGLVGVVVIGFFFCLTLRRTGNLWWAVGFHMAWDWGESYLYSVPDSGAMLPGHLLNSSFHGPEWLTGGTVGPEGSYLVFVVLAALWVVFERAYPEVKYGEGRG